MNWMKELDKRKAYENLANAIIEQAANDFREAKRRLQKNARDAEAEKTYRETKLRMVRSVDDIGRRASARKAGGGV